jgi:hypothetical protein
VLLVIRQHERVRVVPHRLNIHLPRLQVRSPVQTRDQTCVLKPLSGREVFIQLLVEPNGQCEVGQRDLPTRVRPKEDKVCLDSALLDLVVVEVVLAQDLQHLPTYEV